MPCQRILASAVLAGQLSVLSASAWADPVYFGPHYVNPESETFGNPVAPVPEVRLWFMGPARAIGTTSGDPEKDTVAFQTIVVAVGNQPAFGSRGARELQGTEPVFAALDQPAFGAKGARELQGLAISVMQPADGAQAARELQVSTPPTQLADQ